MKRRILLVDDEVAVLLTLKAVLEISGFDVETAASAREAKLKLRSREYSMIITDMRMESDSSGEEVIAAARAAVYKPAIALLTAFPVNDENWNEGGADKLLVKPMQTRVLIEQIEQLFVTHEAKQREIALPAQAPCSSVGGEDRGRKTADSELAPRGSANAMSSLRAGGKKSQNSVAKAAGKK
jgi:DNA-binding response OmpR family regulator